MASTVIVAASGLVTSPNELNRPEGSLTEAKNVVIKRDGIIEQRRGFKLYGDRLPLNTQRVKQMKFYRNRLIRHYANKLQYDSNGLGKMVDFSGIVEEAETNNRLKFVESNGNLYFTTKDGIKKISAKLAADLGLAEIESSGAPKALDIKAELVITDNLQTGFLPQDSTIAYRVVWNKKDRNDNLLTGSPSQRGIVIFPMAQVIVRDTMRVLSTLDSLQNTPLTAARINDKNYIDTLKLTLASTPTQIRTNLIALAAKIDNDIFIADQASVAPLQIVSASITSGICTITFTGGTVTDYLSVGKIIDLKGFNLTPSGTLDGKQVVVTATATQITFNTTQTGTVTLVSPEIRYREYREIPNPVTPSVPASHLDLESLQEYLDTIIQKLQSEPTSIISTADQTLIDDLDLTTTATTKITFAIPRGITTEHFYQVYRSTIAQATGTAVLDDLSPNDELQLVMEGYPTSQQIDDGKITLDDITPEAFRGENLYTNASSGAGILQANDQPPFAKDVAKYKGSVFFANTRTKQRLELNLLGVQQMINDFDNNSITPKITITNGTTTNTYNFVTGQQEITSVTTVADVSNSLNGKSFKLNTAKGKKYRIYFETTTASDPSGPGETGVKVKIATNATATVVAKALSNKISTLLDDFSSSYTGAVVEIVDLNFGEVIDSVDVDSGFTINVTQQGSGEKIQSQVTEFTLVAGANYVNSGTSDYVTINTPGDQNRFVIAFKRTGSTLPNIPNKTLLQVNVTGTETAAQMATKFADILPSNLFETEVAGNVVTVTNKQFGQCTNATEVVADSGFLVSTEVVGGIDILLSTAPSPAQAVDNTARSLVEVINRNKGEIVYAYYLSGAFDVPGKMFLEARSLNDLDPFYVSSNNDVTGLSFSPEIGPDVLISTISTGTSTVTITTATAHGLETGDEIVISSSNSSPSIDGIYRVNVTNSTTFTISAYVGVAGNIGSIVRKSVALKSENEQKVNRIYYSKADQPEAVPIVNYFDLGSSDRAILRIFALRDSLFVFKEDGLYRVSGEGAPFQSSLFDNSFILLAPDSVGVCQNVIYAWTTQGIQSLTEGGASVISRPIDNIILKTQSASFPHFKTATWGIGYESDNSYLVFTVKNPADVNSTIAYRYSTLTNTWTVYDKASICGAIGTLDDKLYLGAQDVAYTEIERKDFSRLDYADREYITTLSNNKILGKKIIVPSVTNFEIGDVIVQDQTVTIYKYNQLLEKLDLDPGPADNNYLNTLKASQGNNLRTKLELLATKLDNDANIVANNFSSLIGTKSGTATFIDDGEPTVITSNNHGLITGRIVKITDSDSQPIIDGTYAVTVINANQFSIPLFVNVEGTTADWETVDDDFDDLKTCFNKIVSVLNDDTGVSFSNYSLITENTIQEAIITNINKITKELTVNLTLDFIVGEATVFKAIKSSITYSPSTFGDPLNLKHIREATLMFETRNLTSGELAFATDLLPEFIKIPFKLDGNGVFGHNEFGEGFFGGLSNAAPLRTYIPRQCQRCRFIIGKFSHTVARENWRLLGMTLTGEIGQSTRAFR
jgi:hypothetical protein